MARVHSALADVFEHYGDDASAGLEALANTDNEFWSRYVDEAAESRYRLDYARWVRSHLVSVQHEVTAASKGQAQLFDMPRQAKAIELREVLQYDGRTYRLADLAGTEGAQVLLAVANRDDKPAKTVIIRNRVYRRLANHIVAETERTGRDVSAGEVLGLSVKATAA